jgi:hypothetical protein
VSLAPVALKVGQWHAGLTSQRKNQTNHMFFSSQSGELDNRSFYPGLVHPARSIEAAADVYVTIVRRKVQAARH